MPRYDNNLVVIGAGSGGLVAALIAATVRARVTLIERGAMGGDCLNTGCVPSKALIASAKVAHALKAAKRYGLTDVTGRVDFQAVMGRVRQAIATIVPKDSSERYASLGVRCMSGDAELLDGHTVSVDGKRVTGRRIILATGAVPFDRLLVAVGRRARPVPLVELNPDGTIAVDDFLRTSIPTIYACGDAVGPYQFTHMASHQAWYAAVNALVAPFWRFRVNNRVVPWATFTDPEVATVGITEAQAPPGAQVTVHPVDDVDRAIADGCTEGFVKIVSNKGRILGATIVAAHAGELISEFVAAMTHGIALNRILGTIHVYPTMMEANKLAAGAWRRANAPRGVLKIAEKAFSALR